MGDHICTKTLVCLVSQAILVPSENIIMKLLDQAWQSINNCYIFQKFMTADPLKNVLYSESEIKHIDIF